MYILYSMMNSFPDETTSESKPTPVLQVNNPPLIAGTYDMILGPNQSLPGKPFFLSYLSSSS